MGRPCPDVSKKARQFYLSLQTQQIDETELISTLTSIENIFNNCTFNDVIVNPNYGCGVRVNIA